MAKESQSLAGRMLKKLWQQIRKDDLLSQLSRKPFEELGVERSREFLPTSERNEINTRGMFRDFEEYHWPIYKQFGIDKGTALIIIHLKSIDARLEDIGDMLDDDED